MQATIEPYPDGRWFPNEHRVNPRYPIVCRGNTGEVYPNVVSPLTGSIVSLPFDEGQRRVILDAGMATREQLEGFDGHGTAVVGMFAGYLYGNVSLTRSMTARTPGLTAEDVDRQMFGLSDAPPSPRGKGDRSPVAVARALRFLLRRLLRPDETDLIEARRVADEVVARAPDLTAPDDVLLQFVRTERPMLDPMMYALLSASIGAGFGRTTLERLVADEGGDGLVNRLTAGLGTIESAEPAVELWHLGRRVAADERLTAAFDAGLDGLDDRLRAGTSDSTAAFVTAFDDFRRRHGARGPEEWELASPTWGSNPSIALAQIDRLRLAPGDRAAGGSAQAQERDALIADVRARLPRSKRWMFDRAVRAAAIGAANREGTKAATVRMLQPMREALAELARRSAFSHDDFFLLLVDEIPSALSDPSAIADVIDERRARRDYLQARVPPFWFEGAIPHPSAWELRATDGAADHSPRTLSGLGVCSGSATGRARIVRDPACPGDLGPDDVMIAPITDPSWTPLFLAVCAVVVDVGAQMSHAAIVSRELGIPAVVSVTGASRAIPDGAWVTVDGDAGTVTVLGGPDR